MKCQSYHQNFHLFFPKFKPIFVCILDPFHILLLAVIPENHLEYCNLVKNYNDMKKFQQQIYRVTQSKNLLDTNHLKYNFFLLF
jgi:hypothetical protein